MGSLRQSEKIENNYGNDGFFVSKRRWVLRVREKICENRPISSEISKTDGIPQHDRLWDRGRAFI